MVLRSVMLVGALAWAGCSHDAGGAGGDAGGDGGGSRATDGGGGAGDGNDGDDGGGTRAACKRGLAYGEHSRADFAVISPAISWWYNWAYLPDEPLRDGSYADAGVAYVPMVWGRSFDGATLIDQIPNGANALLGFNEPNFGAQADMSATEAAQLWPRVQAVADARGLLLVSPAVNYCGGDCRDTDPFRYLDQFLAACAGCRVDHVAFHVYVGCRPDGNNAAQWLIDHVEQYKARFTQPLWLTEFACTDAANAGEQRAFLEDAVAYLENEPRIVRYAWFSGRFPGIPYVDLLGADGQLTALGDAYLAAPAPSCE
jgi:hypothetical protein